MPRLLEELDRTAPQPSSARRREAKHAAYVAVVHTVDGVRFQAAATSRRELVHRIAEYVQRWGAYVLRPDHARHLRGLLLRGELEAAVELYFGLVGKRWDKEWLVTTAVALDGQSRAESALGEVATLSGARDADRSADTSVVQVGRAFPEARERAG